MDTSPAISSGNVLFVGTASGTVTALDAATGALVWSHTLPGPAAGSPAIASNGYLIVPANGLLLALDPSTGMEVWRTQGGNYVAPPVVTTGGGIYCGSLEGSVVQLDQATGRVVAAGDFTPPSSTGATIGNGDLFVVDATYTLNCLLQSEFLLPNWSVQMQTPPCVNDDGGCHVPAVASTLSVDPARNVVYSGADSLFLYAFNASNNGALIWKIPGNFFHSDPAIAPDGTVVIGSESGTVLGVVPVTGATRWKFAAPGPVRGFPAIGADGTVYFGSGSSVFGVSGSTGALVWRWDLGSPVAGSPVIGLGNTLYVPTVGGIVALH